MRQFRPQHRPAIRDRRAAPADDLAFVRLVVDLGGVADDEAEETREHGVTRRLQLRPCASA